MRRSFLKTLLLSYQEGVTLLIMIKYLQLVPVLEFQKLWEIQIQFFMHKDGNLG